MLAAVIPPRGSFAPARRSVLVVTDDSHGWDRELLGRIAKGDDDAYRALFARYAPTALALAQRVIRHRGLAEESVQEAFLEIWRAPTRYDDGRGSVRAWIMTLVHNRSVDALRREVSQQRRAADQAAREPAAEDPVEEVAETLDLPKDRARIRDALASLPGEQREVLELMYFDGLSQTQVADKLGIPLGTVKSRAVLAMRKLRRRLAEVER